VAALWSGGAASLPASLPTASWTTPACEGAPFFIGSNAIHQSNRGSLNNGGGNTMLTSLNRTLSLSDSITRSFFAALFGIEIMHSSLN
jgi:hypothetical protein